MSNVIIEESRIDRGGFDENYNNTSPLHPSLNISILTSRHIYLFFTEHVFRTLSPLYELHPSMHAPYMQSNTAIVWLSNFLWAKQENNNFHPLVCVIYLAICAPHRILEGAICSFCRWNWPLRMIGQWKLIWDIWYNKIFEFALLNIWCISEELAMWHRTIALLKYY